jgi:hypothetical protein
VLRAFVIIIGALVLIGGATGVYLYDRATAIDRSTPTVVADAFLHGVFVEKDSVRVGLYTCPRWSGDDAIQEVQAHVDPEARIAWDGLSVGDQTAERATVHVRMRLSYPGDIAPSGEQRWSLALEEHLGWRVCSVDRGTGP